MLFMLVSKSTSRAVCVLMLLAGRDNDIDAMVLITILLPSC